MHAPNATELRVELPRDEIAVLDGYCQATGQDRSKVIRRVLKEWSDQRSHEAILICRVANINPALPEVGRVN